MSAKESLGASLHRHFEMIEDPRVDRSKQHGLANILTIATIAMIAGADDFVAMAQFAQSKIEWLGKFLRLPNGAPSHDTIGRVFKAIKPSRFEQCFAQWTSQIAGFSKDQVIALDGKCVRGSGRSKRSGGGPVHLVNAWATKAKLVLAQVKTQDKSNEITALPELIDLLDLRDCIVTTDAMGCQKKIAEKIVKGGANYILAVKEDKPTLHSEIRSVFDGSLEHAPLDYSDAKERGHGRQEARECFALGDIQAVQGLEEVKKWPRATSVAMVVSGRQNPDGTWSEQTRYYISSLEDPSAQLMGESIRAHWEVENSLHWVLDMAFGEDANPNRDKNAAANLGALRRIALNFLKKDTSSKIGIANRRRRAGWDNNYMEKILFATPS